MRRREDIWQPTRTLTRWLIALMAATAVLQIAQDGRGTPRSFDRLADAFITMILLDRAGLTSQLPWAAA